MIGDWELGRALWTAFGVAGAVALLCLRPRPSSLWHAPSCRWSSLPRSRRQRWRPAVTACQSAALLALAVAIGEPQRREIVENERVEARDLVLCLDASSSMGHRDEGFEGSRFESCRAVIQQFVAALPDDRIGLLTFARSPAWSCPPTFDHALLREVLDEVEPVEVGDREDRTAIGAVLALAALSLESSEARSRAVILLTDGENNVDDVSPAAAIEWCRQAGIVVEAIAVGEPESLPSLRAAAKVTGGRAWAASDADGLGRALAEIERRARSSVEIEPPVRRTSFAAWFSALALLLWWVGFVLDRGPLARWS